MTPLAPIRKVSAGAAGGALATIALWILDSTGVEVPAAVSAAITTVAMFGVSYLTPSTAVDEPGRHALPDDDPGEHALPE